LVLYVTWFQALLVLVIFAVPIWLMATRNGDRLLLWILAVTCTDVFVIRTGVNLASTSVVGLLLVPYSARVLLASRRVTPVGWATAHLAYLGVLGLAFGFAFPWQDTVGRPFNLQAPGRTILYLMRETAGLSIAVFVAQQVARAGRPDRLLAGILVVSIFTSAAAIAEYLTGISYYRMFTEGVVSPTYWNLRVRGLNFEPRGLGIVGAHAIVIGVLCVAYHWRARLAIPALGTAAGAMFLSASTSGLIATAGGLGAVWMSHRRVRQYLFRIAVVGVIVGGAIAAANLGRVSALQHLLTERVGSTVRFGVASTWFQQIVYRMEVFDASAALFFASNPWYVIFGTGPGLVSLPATPFMPLSPYYVDYVSTGLNSPPSMGWLLELSNGGVIALVMWAGFVFSTAHSLRWAAQQPGPSRRSWIVARWAFVAAAAIYLLAAGFLSSCWPLFMGLGMGAAFTRLRVSTDGAES
jgi:hypothetical protein